MNKHITKKLFNVFVLSLFFLTANFGALAPAVAADGPGNLIANPDLETSADGILPDNWQSGTWGTNTSSNGYELRSEIGSFAVGVTVTDLQDGDAKWFFDPVAVETGQEYSYSDNYMSTTDSELDVRYTKADGSFEYVYLSTLPSTSGSWLNQSLTLMIPADVIEITVFHLIYTPGELWTDDHSLVLSVAPDPDPDPQPQPDPDPDPQPEPGNLIINPSAETANGTLPAAWQTGAWGTNAPQFTYETTGQDGQKSLHVTVSGYQDGDAKWWFDQVAVQPDTNYSFSNYSKGTTASQVVVQFQNAAGSYSYQWLGEVPASTDWQPNVFEFTTPADVASATVFHVLAANGELWTDNFFLAEVVIPPSSSIIPNNSVETTQPGNPGLPVGWQTNAWGDNSASFEYLNSGYEGSHSLKTTISSYTTGDAKWYNAPIELQAGQAYLFSDYYQSDVSSRVLAAVNMSDGTIAYLEMSGAAPGSGWTRYQDSFTMPIGGNSVSFFHLISTAGYLITDNYDVTPYTPVGFSRGLLTLTFDDSWEDNQYTAIPMMAGYGFVSNQFYATTFIANSELDNAEEIIAGIRDAGHEIGSHSITHPDLTTLAAGAVDQELSQSKSYLENLLGISINYFATPYGAYNATVKDQIMSYYSVHRTVDDGYNSIDNFDLTKLKVKNVLDTTTGADVQTWVDTSASQNTWLILVLHRVADDPEPYDTTPEQFADILEVIYNSGIPVVTISEALAELLPQL